MPSPARDEDAPATVAVHRLTVASPVGALTLFEQGDAITALLWASGTRIRNGRATPLLAAARRRLESYFAGNLKRFDLPLAPDGSPFQRRVWDAIAAIPYGETASYGALARLVGSAPRAVGGACGANPIPILIPCHRVLAADGRLHGYSGKGGTPPRSGFWRSRAPVRPPLKACSRTVKKRPQPETRSSGSLPCPTSPSPPRAAAAFPPISRCRRRRRRPASS